MGLDAAPMDCAVAALLSGAAALGVIEQEANWPRAFDPARIRKLMAELASGTGPGPAGGVEGAALLSIVAGVRLGDGPARRAVLRPAALSAEAILPAPDGAARPDPAALAALRRAFLEGWADLVARAGADAAAFEEGLLSLCERLMWALPAPGGPADLPLFDTLRFRAALAAAEAGAGEGRQLRLLSGDLSGLQESLFRLRSERVEDLAKLLRGRSARFQLIAEAALRRALAVFGMPMACALQTAGGRFLVLVPALADAEARLEALRREADAWFAQQYLGGLSLGLALSPPFAAVDLTGPKAEEIGEALWVAGETAKLSRMAAHLAQGVLPVGDAAAGPCPACDQRPAAGPRAAPQPCAACAAEIETGTRLPHAQGVLVGAAAQGADRLLGIDLLILRGKPGQGPARGWRWLSAPPGGAGPPALRPGPPWVARFAGEDPRRRYEALARAAGMTLTTPEAIATGEIETFECLALEALEEEGGRVRGRPLLALLKGDVDRLGQIFARGLGRFDLARRMALSRLMDLYFTLRLPHLLERHAPQSYTLYAGGDDFVLILPWRQGLAFARHLREDFAAFTGDNPDVTFSLGIALFPPHLPVSIAAAEAEARLERAKDDGRNRVSAVEPRSMTWEDFAAALEAAERFNAWLRDGTLATGALHRLLALEEARRRVAAGQGRGPDFGWRGKLAYHVARQRTAAGRPLPGEVAEAIRDLFGLGPDWRVNGPPRPGARLALTHALYRNR